uniref:J domain-containing protein n=1 Tax=Plectus sambesii TaxID=2011161 RepID=A0A914WIL1_9BILA
MRDLMLLSSCWRCHRCQSIGRRLLFLASSASSSVIFDPAFVIQQRRFLRYPSPPERKRNYYEVLGVKRSATPKEIRDAYISQSKKLHPDRVASSQSSSDKGSSGREKFQELQEAYDVLRKPSTRTEYDQKLSEGSSGPRPPNPSNPNQAWNDYQRWMQQQQQYAQYQQQKQSWRMSDDPWENFRRAREQRYAEYQKFYAKQEPFRPRGGANDSPGLALFRFFLIITIATIIAHILQYNMYEEEDEDED